MLGLTQETSAFDAFVTKQKQTAKSAKSTAGPSDNRFIKFQRDFLKILCRNGGKL